MQAFAGLEVVMDDWDNLRVVLAVFRNGSLAAAARTLKIDETTIGRRLKSLERSLGTRLFDRTAQGLIPTEAADAIRAAAETAESAVLDVQHKVRGSDMRPSGFVRITATEALSSQFLIPTLGSFHQLYPDIRLELFSGYIALDVARGEADIAVRALPPVGNHLISRRLGAVVTGLYAAPDYVSRRPIGPIETGLSGHDLIGYSDLVNPRPPGGAFLGVDTQGARLTFTANSPLGLMAAAEAGLGLAMLPCCLAARRPGLRRIWPEHSQRYDLLAVLREDVKGAARIRAVVDHLVRHFRTQTALLEGEPGVHR
jgi:DNA-binding transcriptional LysR family regulator